MLLVLIVLLSLYVMYLNLCKEPKGSFKEYEDYNFEIGLVRICIFLFLLLLIVVVMGGVVLSTIFIMSIIYVLGTILKYMMNRSQIECILCKGKK